jgi:MoxR-like ATPase
VAIWALSPVAAQEYRGNLFVLVQKEDGTAVSGAQVTLTGSAYSRTLTTEADGKARFVLLDPGNYTLKVNLDKYASVVHEGIEINTSSSATLYVKLIPAEKMQESVMVTAQTPILDQRKTGTSTVLTQAELSEVPTARDPWAVLSTVPGITTDRVNVAGNESGQQSNFVGKGDDGSNTTWWMDGVEFTDIGAIGATSSYLDFNSFEEIGFGTGGGDAEQANGGARLNFTTKQGSNDVKGDARMWFTQKAFQSAVSGIHQPSNVVIRLPGTNGPADAGNNLIPNNHINEVFEEQALTSAATTRFLHVANGTSTTRTIEAAGMPEEVKKEATKELNRLARMSPMAADYSVTRNYIEWLAVLPWSKSSGVEADIKKAAEVLDSDHYDLKKVKERILDYLSVRRLKPNMKGPILCFVGPPGVGKTSLGQSIARAMGRKFARASLGGVHDEAEIRGHRRTYIGAMPGRILQAIRRAESNDPVFILDEVDKIGSDWRGDPSSALLEVLDPEQNKDFRDNYLDVPFDLSKVMFITTANSLETIPPALRDRMEVLNLSGYTEEEKVQIAERFLVPKQLLAHGLRPGEVALAEEAVRVIIREYTREAGVRNLEREIASVMRRTVADIAVGKRPRKAVDVKRVRAALGKRRHYDDIRERIDRPGVATGLVWTPTGGEIIFVEAALTPGKGELKLTGQLGDVMKESAAAALSYLKARAADIGIDPLLFDKNDIHVHVPAGAQPKEGPSAGVTVLTAMASILTGRPARDDIAMTGEITLRGRVLPIGGIKEKVLGAHRAGIRRVLLPTRNEADLDDIPADLRSEMELVLVDSIDEVLREALTKAPASPRQRSRSNGAAAPPGRERVVVAAPARGSAHARKAPPSRPAAKARRRRAG